MELHSSSCYNGRCQGTFLKSYFQLVMALQNPNHFMDFVPRMQTPLILLKVPLRITCLQVISRDLLDLDSQDI